MSMSLEVNGTPYTRFKSMEVSQTLDQLSGSFRFDAASESGQEFPFKSGDECRVLVDDTPVLTGFIDVIQVSYNESTHSISVAGRDKTADLIDGTLKGDVSFFSGITLKGVAERVISAIGANINVIDQVGTLAPFSSSEKISAEIGMGAWDLIEQYCRKRQVIGVTNGDGDLVLTRGGLGGGGNYLRNQVGVDGNNIKSATVMYDASGRYNSYIVASQLNPVAFASIGAPDAKSVASASGSAVDPSIRTSRVLYMQAENASDSSNCKERANWECNVRRIRGFSYSALVARHSVTGEIWGLNTLINVADEFAGISGTYLVNGVSFTQDEQSGSETSISIVEPDAYTPEPTPTPKQKSRNIFEVV